MEILTMVLTIAVVLASFFLLLAFAYLFLLHSGFRAKFKIRVGSPPIGQAVVAYKFGRGTYCQSTNLLHDVKEIVPGFKCLRLHYVYDAPDWSRSTKMRYAVGVVLSEGTQQADVQVVKMLTTAGFRFFQLPQVESAVCTSFPNVNFLSACFASIDMFPCLKNFVKKHGLCAHPFVEVYEDKTIRFMAPLSRQGDFYIPEFVPLVREEESCEPAPHGETEESCESLYGDDATQDLSDSDSHASSDDDTQTEDSDLESPEPSQEPEDWLQEPEDSPQEPEDSPQEVGSQEPENSPQEVGSQEPENSPQEVGSQEPENMPQEVGALPQTAPEQDEGKDSDGSLSSFEELECEWESDDDNVQ